MKGLSIIIPVYNEEKFIGKTLLQVCAADSLNLNKEIIIIDDASEDGTKTVIKKTVKILSTKYPKIDIKIISKIKNKGKGAAIKEGLKISTGDIVLIQDADLEYDPNDYHLLLEPFIRYEANVVYGSRFISNRPHRVLYFWHYQINILLTTFSNMLTNLNLTDMESGYKAFKGDLIRQIANDLQSERFGFEPEITARISKMPELKLFEVGISYSGRTYSEGKKIGWRDGIKAVWEIVKFNLLSS